MAIKYDEKKNRVKQRLESLSMYDLEGDLAKASNYLQDKLRDLIKSSEEKMNETTYNGGGYADGTNNKSVKFDKFYIEVGEDYEGDRELQIWGERDILAEEMEGLKKKAAEDKKKSDEYKRKQYEALKKELGE